MDHPELAIGDLVHITRPPLTRPDQRRPDAIGQHSQRCDRAGFDQRAGRKAGVRGEVAREKTVATRTRLLRDFLQ